MVWSDLRRRRSGTILLFSLLTAPALAAQARGPRALSLDEALARADSVSETVGIARAGVERARGEQTRSRAELYPQLSGSASYTRTLKSQFTALAGGSDSSSGPVDSAATRSCRRFLADPTLPIAERLDSLESAVACSSAANPFASLGSLPFGQRNQYNLGLSFSQTLYAGGRVRSGIRSADAVRRSAEIELVSQRAEARLDVTTAYFDAALSDRLLAIAESSLAQSERTLKDVELGRQVGTLPEFDLLRARVTRDNLRPLVIQRRASRQVGYLRLMQLLDLPLGQPLALTSVLDVPDSVALPPPASAPGGEIGDTSTAARAPVRRAAEAVTSQQAAVGMARAGARPLLRLTSQFARIAYPRSGLPGWNDFVSDWSAALILSVPLFTGGRLKGDRIVARANLDESRLRLRQTEEQAALDAQSVLALLESARAIFEASGGTVTQARRAYGIAEVRYREGISTQTELNDSRLQLQQAEANRAQAARDLQVVRTRAALLRDLPLAGAAAAPATVSSAATASTTTAGTTGTTGTTGAGGSVNSAGASAPR